MGCKTAVWIRMLQICTNDIWPCCECGYLYFYDAMTAMEKILSNSFRESTQEERYSLAAACLVKSFQRLNPEDPGWQALLHLIVHRLQSMTRTNGHFYVSANDILALLLEIEPVYFECANDDEDKDEAMVLDEDNESEDNLKYLGMFLNEGLEKIRRPVSDPASRMLVPTFDCLVFWNQRCITSKRERSSQQAITRQDP